MAEKEGSLKIQPGKIAVPPMADRVNCHRQATPFVVQQPNPLNPSQMGIQAMLSWTECIKSKCMLWNPDGNGGKGECWDVTAAREKVKHTQELVTLNKAIDLIDGLMRQTDSHH